MNKILTGSRLFFDGIEGFNPKDTDCIQFVESKDVNFIFRKRSFDRTDGTDTFYVVKQDKKHYLRWAAKFAYGSTLGQFLTPEFCHEMGITIDDLPMLTSLCERLDDRHRYLKIIFDAYIENGAMELKEHQRLMAYEEYKKERSLK